MSSSVTFSWLYGLKGIDKNLPDNFAGPYHCRLETIVGKICEQNYIFIQQHRNMAHGAATAHTDLKCATQSGIKLQKKAVVPEFRGVDRGNDKRIIHHDGALRPNESAVFSVGKVVNETSAVTAAIAHPDLVLFC